jgi:hypothetical protein
MQVLLIYFLHKYLQEHLDICPLWHDSPITDLALGFAWKLNDCHLPVEPEDISIEWAST